MAWYCQTILAFSLLGCASEMVTVKTHPTFAAASIKTIGLVPFIAVTGSPAVYQSFGEIPQPDAGSSMMHASLSSAVLPFPHRPYAMSVSVPSVAAAIMTEMVYANLKFRPQLKVVPAVEVIQALQRSNIHYSKAEASQLAQELGKALSLDAVIVGQVRVYRERVGQQFAAIPAAVGFDVQIINAQDGTVVWMGDYFEEQKPLTQDLQGFFERGGRWVTAEELARSGVKRVMQRLPLGNP